MVRGGSWNNNQNNARAAYRNNNHPDNRNNNIGFRVVGFVHSPHRLLWPRPCDARGAAWAARPGNRHGFRQCLPTPGWQTEAKQRRSAGP